MAKKKECSEQSVPIPDLIVMDRDMANLQKIMSQQKFESMEEANKFLDKLIKENNGQLPAQPAETPAEQAQELIYKAHEAVGRKRLRLARKALEVYPDCSDAYVMLAVESAGTDDEERFLYEQAVAAAERHLGPKYFTDSELVGHFWGLIETRPYMRARAGLACLLWDMEERESAIEHTSELLRLNPNDNQGLRYHLLAWLIVAGRDDEARQVLEQYVDDISSIMPYIRALLAFREYGAGERARESLQAAFRANRYVPLVVATAKGLPDEPGHYSIGGVEEAIEIVHLTLEAWAATPGGFDWLAQESADLFKKIARELNGIEDIR